MSELGATIEELVRTLKARRVRVPAEIGTFVALECAEHLLDGPALVTMKDVRLSEDGFVSLFVTPGSASEEASAQSLVTMLASLLVAAGTAVPAPLIGIVESGGPTGPQALAELRDMLEAALVPLNRQAARRVLSRMIREARRPATERPTAAASAGLDDAIDALLDGEATARYPATFDPGPASGPAPARSHASSRPPVLRPPSRPVERPSPPAEELSRPVEEPPPSVVPPVAPAEPVVAPPAAQLPVASPVVAVPIGATAESRAAPRAAALRAAPEQGPRAPRPIELTDDLPPPSRGGGAWLVLATVVAGIAVAALVVARQRPDLVDRALGRPSADAQPDAAVRPPPPIEAGTLEVRSTPAGAQVFLFVGRGPAVVDDLPSGVAHEFLVVAEGRAPQRVIVPPDATWETSESGRRYELAAQAGPPIEEGVDPASVPLGPSLMPREPGSPGDLGSVRVVTNPPGAKVFMLIGFTPDVHVENLPTDQAYELLVWAEGHRLERALVGPSDWAGEGSAQTASVDVALEALPPPRRR